MKVAFDENIPEALIGAFSNILKEDFGDYEICSAAEYADNPAKSDVPWIEKFVKAGGKVVISGDKKMRGKPPERQALQGLGLITIFFHPRWDNLKFHDRIAMFIKWWPHIIDKIEASIPGQCWEIPMSWTGGAQDMRNVTYEPEKK